MARFCGKVGYSTTVDKGDGVWENETTERTYYGDITRNIRKYETSNVVNGNVDINNLINIVADAYAYENFFAIRYVKWMGVAWTVTNVEVQRPRLILTVGGVYNGDTTTA